MDYYEWIDFSVGTITGMMFVWLVYTMKGE